MDILAILLITGAFAALGLFIAMKLTPDRKENKDKFLMTVLLCVSLAIVVSGLVRKPVVKLIRSTSDPVAAENSLMSEELSWTTQTPSDQPSSTDAMEEKGLSEVNRSDTRARFIADALEQNGLFKLIREAAPEIAGDMMSRGVTMAEQAQKEGMDLSLTDWEVSVILWEKLVPGGVGIAPDAAAIRFAKGLSHRLRELLRSSPEDALALLSPRSYEKANSSILALTGPFGEGVRAVVMGAYNEPVPVYDPDESAQLFDAAMQDFVAELIQKHGEAPDLSAQLALLEDPAALQKTNDHALLEAIPNTVADMLDFVLSRPEKEQAILIKHIFSGPE